MEEKKCQDGGMRSSLSLEYSVDQRNIYCPYKWGASKSETKNPKEFRDWKARWAEWLFLVLQSQTLSLFLFSFRVDVKIFHLETRLFVHSTGSLSHNPDIEGAWKLFAKQSSRVSWANICLTPLTRSPFWVAFNREPELGDVKKTFRGWGMVHSDCGDCQSWQRKFF